MDGAAPQRNPLRMVLTGAVLLAVFVLLNVAVVVPALHSLWHADHVCNETECVVLAVAQGSFENPEALRPLERAVAPARTLESPAPSAPVIPHVGSPPSERAPPV